MTFSPTEQLAVLADNIAGHEQQLRAMSAMLSTLTSQLQGTLEVLEWDRARLEGLKVLAAQGQASSMPTFAAAAEVDPAAEAKGDIDSAFYSTGLEPERTALVLEDLTAIKGIGTDTAFRLAGLGVTSFVDVAALTESDVEEIGAMLGDRRRIGKECWIEQAAILASGRSTAYSARMLNGETQSLTATAPVAREVMIIEAVALLEQIAEAVAEPVVEVKAALAEAAVEIVAAATVPEAAAIAGLALAESDEAKVIDLAGRRRQRSRGRARLAAAAMAASLFGIITATGYYTGAFNADLSTHLSRLGACSAQTTATDTSCAVLAWLSL